MKTWLTSEWAGEHHSLSSSFFCPQASHTPDLTPALNSIASPRLVASFGSAAELAIMADEPEDAVDPKPEIEELGKPRCVKPWLAYQACIKRVEEDTSGHKHCTGQYFDYWGCIDKFAANRLFERLK